MNREGCVRRLTGFVAFAVAVATPVQGQTLTVSGDPAPVVVSTAVAGLPPTAKLESSTTYSVDAGASTVRISGRLDAPLPAGIELRVTLEAPAGATAMGEVTLSTLDQELVRDIPSGSYAGLGITYRLVATSAAGTLSPSSRAVVLTLIEGS